MCSGRITLCPTPLNPRQYVHQHDVCPCSSSFYTCTTLYMKLPGVCNHTFWCCMAPMTCSYTSYCSGSCPVYEVGSSKRSRSLVQKPSGHDHEVMGRLCQQANIVTIWLLDSWPDVCEGLQNHGIEAVWLYSLLSDSILSYGRHWC